MHQLGAASEDRERAIGTVLTEHYELDVSQLDVAVTGDLGATLVRSVVVHRQAIDAQTASAIHRVLAVGPRLYARTDHRTAVTELLNLESLQNTICCHTY